MPPTYLFGCLFSPGIMIEPSAMERIVRENGRDWTIVRPPQLTDKPYTGKYGVQERHLLPFCFNISRADVADSFIKTAEDRTSMQKKLGTTN